MIKKSLLLVGLLLGTPSLFAAGNLATFKYGLTSLDYDDGFDFSKHSFRVDGMVDNGYVLKPRFGLAYVSVDESSAQGGVSGLVQIDGEGVYEIESNYLLTPYLAAGIGYEYVMDSRPGFDSQFYVDGAIGLRYPLQNGINLVSEFKAFRMLDSDSQQDAEFVFYVGVGLPFGAPVTPRDTDGDGVYDYADMCPNTPAGIEVDLRGCKIEQRTTNAMAQIDSDHDTVPDSIDICPNTPPGVGVNDRGCPVRAAVSAHAFNAPEPPVLEAKAVTPVISAPVSTTETVITEAPKEVVLDSDHDGIEDINDQCPNTPRGFTVNSIGCEVKKTLDVKFDSNAYQTTLASRPNIRKFAQFLKRYPNAKVKIVGYTDSSGSRARNQVLSERRAASVKSLLVQYGIPSSRIRAIGKGDLNPIATNDTPEGREQNRRIEAEIE